MHFEKTRALALSVILSASALALTGCGSETTDGETVDLGITLLTGANAITSAGEATSTSDGGLTRISQGTRSPRSVLLFPDQPDCNESASGWPADGVGTGSGGSGGDETYNQAFMSCVMKSADTGGETALGALANAYGYVCALGGSNGLSMDGESHAATISIDTTCFPQQTVDQMASFGVESADVTYVGSTTEFYGNDTGQWTGSLRITGTLTVEGESATLDTILLYKEQTGGVTIASVNGPDATLSHGSPYDGFVVQVDETNGAIRFEYRSQGYNTAAGLTGSDARNRHIKALFEGTMDSTGAFSTLTNAEMIYSNLWAVSQEAQNLGSIKTLRGNTSEGFFMNTYEQTAGATPANLELAASYSNPLSFCFTGGACTDNPGLTLDSDPDTAFLFPPSATSTSEDWFTSLVPPSYESVSWTD